MNWIQKVFAGKLINFLEVQLQQQIELNATARTAYELSESAVNNLQSRVDELSSKNSSLLNQVELLAEQLSKVKNSTEVKESPAAKKRAATRKKQ